MNIPFLICINVLLIQYFTNTNPIKIPFHSKLCESNKNNDTFSQYYGQYLYTSTQIGSKKQKLDLALKLNRYITYTTSTKNTNLKSDHFDEKKSDTYKCIDPITNPSQSKEDEFWSALKSKDDFIFGENIIFNQYIFYLSQEQKFDETGHIGLQMQPHYYDASTLKGNNFISQLKSKSLIKSNNFYFKYEIQNEQEFTYKGNLIIGNMPHEVEPSDLFKEENFISTYVNLGEYQSKWLIDLSYINYGDQIIMKSSSAEISTTFGFIEAPSQFFHIYDYFFNLTDDCGGDYTNEKKDYFYLYCRDSYDISKFKDLHFFATKKEFNFTLTYKDLFKKIGKYYIFLILFNEDINCWRFGHIFLNKYTIVFNDDQKTIGYYYNVERGNEKIGEENDNNNDNGISTEVFIIVSIIFSLIIVGLLVYIFYFRPKQNRKIRTNELKENFDYTPDKDGEEDKKDNEEDEENKLGV